MPDALCEINKSPAKLRSSIVQSGLAMFDLINSALDINAIRQSLLTTGFVQINDYLPLGTAEVLYDCLDNRVQWDLAWSEHGTGRQIKAPVLAGMSPVTIRETVASAFDTADSGMRFVYNTFRVIDSWRSGEYAQHPLYTLANAMHTPEHLAFIRTITGNTAIRRMDVLAARYLPGHFLTPHDDAHDAEGREVTWILNLTRDWQPEWGGLLHLMDADRHHITHTLIPRFNSMVLFHPPRWHFVSQVANFARKPRYTLTGWMLNT